MCRQIHYFVFFFQAEDGIRDKLVTGVQTCALPISGKRLSGKTRNGSPWLKSALVEAAHGASHTKDKYLSAQYRRIVSRRGKKRALIAVGHSILVIAYHLLVRKEAYKDLGGNYFDEQQRKHVKVRLVRRLERLGYEVALQERVA